MPTRSGDDDDFVPKEQPLKKKQKLFPKPWKYFNFTPLQLDPEVPNFGYLTELVHNFKNFYDVFKAFFTDQWIGLFLYSHEQVC